MTLGSDQILNNRYRISSVIGQGSSGTVYRAWDLTLNSPVAVKELLNTSSEAVYQFSLEARLLANLRHENLPYVIDHFSIHGQGQYLVMEFIEGTDLRSMIDRAGGGLPEEQVLTMMGGVCEALTYLHTQSPPIIHRDVKPANIKVTPNGRTVLVDYGIARLYGAVQRTMVVGEPMKGGFASPEQLEGREADARSDIYSLGATMYAALTGKSPPDALQRQKGQSTPPPRQLNPSISSRTEMAILRCLDLNPDGRFQTVDEVRDTLGSRMMQAPAGIPATMRVGSGLTEDYDPFSSETPQKRSNRWIIWVLVVGIAVCLIGGILGGLGIYAFILAPGQATSTPTTQLGMDLSATQTALAAQLATPSPTTTSLATDTAPPTLLPTPTFTPSEVPSETLPPEISPSPSPTLDPQATWQPCQGAPPSRLHIGFVAVVSADPPLPNRVRTQPSTDSDILGFIQPGEQVRLLEGPACSNQWVWWRIRSFETGITGWTAEGDDQDYWLVPVSAP